MREYKKIDKTAEAIGGGECLIRLLCTPLYYDEMTHQVNPDAFDLRLLGKNQEQKEYFVSLFRKGKFADEDSFLSALHVGYDIWDKKPWETNSFFGYGTFVCQDALDVNSMIEIWPLLGSDVHIGMFYAKSDDEYYSGPLPKDNPEILEMLTDLADLITDTVEKAPEKC